MIQPMTRPIMGMAALAVVAGLALAGCYISSGLLLDPGSALQPIPGGDYVSSDGSVRRLTVLPDGWYAQRMRQPGGAWGPSGKLLANRLGKIGGRDVYVVAQYARDIPGYVYAVVAVRGDGFALAAPDCSKPAVTALARTWGGRPETLKDLDKICSFSSGRSLFGALREFAARAEFEAPYRRRGSTSP